MKRFVTAALAATLTLGAFAPSLMADVPEELATQIQPIVEEGLASADVAVQAWALRAAGLLDNNDLRDTVAAALANESAPVRISAALALISMDHNADDAIAQLATELVDGDAPTRALLLDTMLPTLDADTRQEVLADALERTSGDTERVIIRMIAQRESGDIYDLLLRAAASPDEAQRAVYVSTAVAAGREEGLALAAAFAEAGNVDDAAEIGFAIDTPAGTEFLGGLLGQADGELAQRIGFYLARRGDTDALGQVAGLAANAEADVALRTEALELLRERGAAAITFEQLSGIVAEGTHTQEFLVLVHQVMGATQTAEARTAIDEALASNFGDERVYGIAGAGFMNDTSYTAVLVETMEGHAEAYLRFAAAESLGRLGGEEAATALMDALRVERTDEMKIAFLQALGYTGVSSVAQTISYQFAQQNDALSFAALDALQRLGNTEMADTIASIAETYRGPDVRWRAAIALVHLDPERGRDVLMEQLDRPPENFYADIETLPQDLRDTIDEALLTHSSTDIREAALFRVMRRADGGLSVLRRMVVDATQADVRRQAVATVIAWGLAEDAGIFRGLTEDSDRSVRMQGYAALAELADPEYEQYFTEFLTYPDLPLRMVGAYALLRFHTD